MFITPSLSIVLSKSFLICRVFLFFSFFFSAKKKAPLPAIIFLHLVSSFSGRNFSLALYLSFILLSFLVQRSHLPCQSSLSLFFFSSPFPGDFSRLLETVWAARKEFLSSLSLLASSSGFPFAFSFTSLSSSGILDTVCMGGVLSLSSLPRGSSSFVSRAVCSDHL